MEVASTVGPESYTRKGVDETHLGPPPPKRPIIVEAKPATAAIAVPTGGKNAATVATRAKTLPAISNPSPLSIALFSPKKNDKWFSFIKARPQSSTQRCLYPHF